MSTDQSLNKPTGSTEKPPQVIVYAAPTGRFWKILSLLILLVFLAYIFVSGLEIGPSRESKRLIKTLIKDEGVTNNVVLIQLRGILYGGYLEISEWNPVKFLYHGLKQAENDPSVEAVILRIDSPGGEIMAVEEMYEQISRFQKETGKPVVAFLDGLAASGGYYVASACRWIMARPLTITGSIGVIFYAYNYRGLLDKIGIRPTVYKSGQFKDLLRGDKAPEEISPEEEKIIQSIVDESYQTFINRIKTGRLWASSFKDYPARPLSQEWTKVADGRIFLGQEAYDVGLIDELANFEECIERIKTLVNKPALNLIELKLPKHYSIFLQFLQKGISHITGNFALDSSISKFSISPGRLYAIWPGVIGLEAQ